MAQVYSFVDDNGVTRLFAEIVPDPAGTPFNGGTITDPLLIAPATNPGAGKYDFQVKDANASGIFGVRETPGLAAMVVFEEFGVEGNFEVWNDYDNDAHPALSVNRAQPNGVLIAESTGYVGFYGTAPILKQTGVAVNAAGIHAALVALGLIAA